MSRAAFPRSLALGAAQGLALLLSACSAGSMGGSAPTVEPNGVVIDGSTDLATQQACRERVNEMYNIRERGEIYAPASAVNTPYSSNYEAGVPSRGLSNQFAYGQSLAECERNARNGSGPTLTPAAPPASPPAAPPAATPR